MIHLMGLTSSIVDRLTGPQPSDDEIRRVYEDLAEAGLGWTALAEQGRFLEVSTPYSQAITEIIAGMNTQEQSQVKKGLDTIIAVARAVESPH